MSISASNQPITNAASVEIVSGSSENPNILAGTANPAVSGLAAPKGSIYLRYGTPGEIWLKTGSGNLDWTQGGGGGGGGRFFPPEQWTVKSVAASLTNSEMSAQVSTDYDTWKAIRAGSITGIASRLTTAISAGTLDVSVTVNGTVGFLTINHSSGSNSTGGVATQVAGIDTYAAGDLIGIKITTDGSWAPSGNDLEAYLELQDA